MHYLSQIQKVGTRFLRGEEGRLRGQSSARGEIRRPEANK